MITSLDNATKNVAWSRFELGSDDTEIAFVRLGHFFICSTWIQSQMAHLNVFADDRGKIEPFLQSPDRVPRDTHLARVKYFEKDFGKVLAKFREHFQMLYSENELVDLETLRFLRNAIGHAYVSKARSFILYRPANDRVAVDPKLQLKSQDIEDVSDPLFYKIDFTDESTYLYYFRLITCSDEIYMKRACEHIGVTHSRIR